MSILTLAGLAAAVLIGVSIGLLLDRERYNKHLKILKQELEETVPKQVVLQEIGFLKCDQPAQDVCAQIWNSALENLESNLFRWLN